MGFSDSLNNFLDQIQSKAKTIAINISARSEIEIMELDKNFMITNYSSIPISYNAFTKEIENFSQLENQLRAVLGELGISPKSSKAYVSIPTVVIDHAVLFSSIKEGDASNIKTALMAELEKNYIFKKYDAASSYYEIESEAASDQFVVCYTGIREDQFAQIKNILEDELGLTLLAIDSSFSSLINGVVTTGKIDQKYIEEKANWSILNITSNSYMLFYMRGNELVSVYEEPLAVKSFSEEEVYQVIISSFELIMNNYPSAAYVVVSQSDDVSAEYLSSLINTRAKVTYIDDNKSRKQLVEVGLNVTQSKKVRISLEAVGIANWAKNDGFKFNFVDVAVAIDNTVDSIYWGDKEITPKEVLNFVIIISAIAIVLTAAVYIILISLNNSNAKSNDQLENEIRELQRRLDRDNNKVNNGISEKQFLLDKYTYNKEMLKSYGAVGRSIPEMLWIEEFQLSENSKIFLKGRSYRMDDILSFYDNLSTNANFPNLTINQLEISQNELSDRLVSDNADDEEKNEITYFFIIGDNVAPANPKTSIIPIAPPKDEQQPTVDSDGNPLPPGASLPAPPPPSTPKKDVE